MDMEETRYLSFQKIRKKFLYYSLLVNIFILAFFLVFDSYHHIYVGAWTDFFALTAASISFYSLNNQGLKDWHIHLALLGGIAICAPLLVIESYENTGIYWLPIMPFLLFILGGTRIGLFWLRNYFVLILLSILVSYLGLVPQIYQLGEIAFIMLVTSFMSAISYIFVRYLEQGERMILSQQAQVESALKQAEHASQAKSHFLSVMSHDLRTPLHGIIGMQELLKQDNQHWSAEQKEHLNLALHASHTLKDLLNNVLDLAKIESDKMQVHLTPIPTLDFMHGILLSFVFQAQEKHLALNLHIQNMPHTILSDEKILRQILLNLLSNALKFTHQGSIDVYVSQVGQQIEFSVQDTGAGIPEREQEHIFDAFQQCSTASHQQGGTGLGTAIVKQCVELLGGTISLSSQVGQGSQFSFTLPYSNDGYSGNSASLVNISWGIPDLLQYMHKASKTSPLDNMEAVNEQRDTHLSVLLVEDDHIAQRLTCKTLQRAGMSVELANHGFEALEKLQTQSYDVMLTDLHMPKMDGMTLIRKVRETNATMPIIGLSAHALTSLIDEAKAAGMNDFLSKPIAPEAILQCVQKLNTP